MKIFRQSSSCPTCDRPISRDKVIVDNEFQKEIQNLPVFCSNNLNGCKWEGIFKTHLVLLSSLITNLIKSNGYLNNLKLHFEECEYTQIECIRGCGLRYQRKDERQHIAEDCLKNEISCEFCRTKVSKADEMAHLNVCPKFFVPCPSDCGVKQITRENVFYFI